MCDFIRCGVRGSGVSGWSKWCVLMCRVIGMCVHRVGVWVAGERDHCPVDREPSGTRGHGEGAAGEGRGRDGSACESVAGRGQ